MQGWFYGLSKMLEDFKKWSKTIAQQYNKNTIEQNNWIHKNKLLFSEIPCSLKRHLAIEYKIFLLMKPSAMKINPNLDIEDLDYNATIYWLESRPEVFYDSLNLISKFKEHGKRFKLHRAMAKALANTNLPEKWETMIRLPFPITQIELPGPDPEFRSSDTDTTSLLNRAIGYIFYENDKDIKIVIKSKLSGICGWSHDITLGDTEKDQAILRIILILFYI